MTSTVRMVRRTIAGYQVKRRPRIPFPQIIGAPTTGQIHAAGTATVAVPTGPGIGQYIAVVTGEISLLTVPSGWTQIYIDSSSGYHAAYSATPSSSPGTSWVSTDTDGLAICITAYDRPCTIAQTVGTEPTSPSATATGPCLALRIIWLEGGTNTTLSYPSSAPLGQVQVVQNSSQSFAQVSAMAHQNILAAGAVASATWTSSASGSDPAATFLLYGA